jgi:hypothetical protein
MRGKNVSLKSTILRQEYNKFTIFSYFWDMQLQMTANPKNMALVTE